MDRETDMSQAVSLLMLSKTKYIFKKHVLTPIMSVTKTENLCRISGKDIVYTRISVIGERMRD